MLQYNRTLDEGQFCVLDFYSADQLTVRKRLRSVWEEVPCTVTQNCSVSVGCLSMSRDAEVRGTAVFAV